MRQKIFEIVATWVENYLTAWEQKKKFDPEAYEFCNKCRYVHEYRLHERKLFVRCQACRHVHSKRDMTNREYKDILNYELNDSKNNVEEVPARMGATVMENDGKKFLSNKERIAYIRYCENMTQYYRADKFIQFHMLDDFELMEYVDCYRYDEGTASVLDEVCDGKG